MAEIPKPYTYSQTVDAIYRAYEDEAKNWDSIGIPVGQAANECPRYLWYLFRWVHETEVHDGKQLRLFGTGNREEVRIIEDLERAGIKCSTAQLKLKGVFGHARGKIDGVAFNVPEAPKSDHVLECKSANEKNFNAIKKHGVAKAKPDHFTQVQLYMHWHTPKIKRTLYVVVNKNTDELYSERIRHDPEHCWAIERRLSTIVFTPHPPAKLHEDPTKKAAWQCRFCAAREVCHDGGTLRVNCRTCLYSTPQKTGDWLCERHDKKLTLDDQRAACPDHRYIPQMVPLEQIDASQEENWIEYERSDGGRWRDDSKEKAANGGVV